MKSPRILISSQGGPPSYFQALSDEDWELLLEGLLPPEWLEDQVLAVTEVYLMALTKAKVKSQSRSPTRSQRTPWWRNWS